MLRRRFKPHRAMFRKVAALLLVALLLPCLPARAEELARIAQVALLPLAGRPADVEDLAGTFWGDYLGRDGEHGFSMDDILAGRIDLDGDGDSEIFLMIDKESWRADHGKPFVVARWRRGAWVSVGWGWGDEDGVFLTAERRSGWHTIDAGPHYLRWQGRQYQATAKE